MSQKTPGEAERRLAASRQALFRYVNRDAAQPAAATQPQSRHAPNPTQIDNDEERIDDDNSQPMSVWAVSKKAGRIWWHYHPARTALAVVEPLMGAYAERHPWKLLGMAAGAGALAVVTRPWKLISVTGLALATLRSSQVSAVIASLVTPDNEQKRRDYE